MITRIILYCKCPHLLYAQKTLLKISTPGNSEFRQYMSPSKIEDMIAPSLSDINRAVTFLQQYGAVVVESSQHKVYKKAPLLNTTYDKH